MEESGSSNYISLRNHQRDFQKEARHRIGFLTPTLTQGVVALSTFLLFMVVHVWLGLRLPLAATVGLYLVFPILLIELTSDTHRQGVTLQKWLEIQFKNLLEPRWLGEGMQPIQAPASVVMLGATYEKVERVRHAGKTQAGAPAAVADEIRSTTEANRRWRHRRS